MEAIDFERSRISWTLKGNDTNGSWRVIATACRQDSADCIYGKIFGPDRLPIEPPFSYQLVATRDRHAMVREGEASGRGDSEADHGATFSSFEIHAPPHATEHLEISALDSGAVTQQWPLSVRLKAAGQRGELWNLEFPLSHISTRAAKPDGGEMNIGIFRDFDPEVRKQAEERAELISILADRWGCSFEEAKDWLDYEDDLCRRLFAVGNTYPRSLLN